MNATANNNRSSNTSTSAHSPVYGNKNSTLCFFKIPLGVTHSEIYEALFGEPASILDTEEKNSTVDSAGGVPVAHPGVRNSRWMIRRVRPCRPAGRGTYGRVFVEFATAAAAECAKKAFEERAPVTIHGWPIKVEFAKTPIKQGKGNGADYDLLTNRPCLFGLTADEIANVNAWYGFSQTEFNAAYRASRPTDLRPPHITPNSADAQADTLHGRI